MLSVATPSEPTGTWTVMVYITADDLAPYTPANLVEMEQAVSGFPDSVRIVALYDQWQPMQVATGNGTQAPWGTIGFATIQGDPHSDYSPQSKTIPRIASTFQIRPEQNTGAPNTLAAFIVEAAQAAPAQNYALIMWDHGGSVEGLNFDRKDGLPDDNLNVPKVVSALQAAKAGGVDLSLLAFDECLMGSAEVAYAVRDLVPYMVGSEELEDGTGYDYKDALKILAQDPASVTPEQLATSLVNSFGERYVGKEFNDTQSAVRTDRLAGLIDALETFTMTTERARSADWAAIRRARSVAENFGPGGGSNTFRDLGQFLDSIARSKVARPIRESAAIALQALDSAVIAKTSSRRDVRGLSVTMPTPGYSVPFDYARLAPEFTAATGWDDFLRRLQTAGDGPACEDPVDWAEDNNTASAATVLGVVSGHGGALRELTLPHDDLDWYSFSIQENGGRGDSIRLLGAPPDADVMLGLFEKSAPGRPIRSGRAAISLENLEGGDYLVRVSHAERGGGFAYSLAINAPVAPEPTSFPRGNTSLDAAQDLGPVNDAFLVTLPVGEKNGTSTLTRVDASQAAWYSFLTMPSIRPLTGTISVSGSAGRLVVTLYDEQGRPVRTDSRRHDVQIPYVASGAGERYYFSVGGDAGRYKIFFSSLVDGSGRVPRLRPPGARRFALSSSPRTGSPREHVPYQALARARVESPQRPPARPPRA